MKVNVVVYRRSESEKGGILKIRIYDKKTTYISLDEKINLSDFSESKQRVKATHPKADQINRKIVKKLSEISDEKNTFKKVEISEHLGFYEYSERFIKNQKTISSKKKYKTIVSNFRAFLSSYTDSDNVKLIDITDVLGRKLKTIANEQMSANTHEFNISNNQSEFQNGIYFLRINIGGVQKVERLIIQN